LTAFSAIFPPLQNPDVVVYGATSFTITYSVSLLEETYNPGLGTFVMTPILYNGSRLLSSATILQVNASGVRTDGSNPRDKVRRQLVLAVR
jgi:hypothetical protein